MNNQLRPFVLVIPGGGGDLTRRKLVPALYNLYLEGKLPASFQVLGVDRQPLEETAYQSHLRQGIDQFSRRGPSRDEDWQGFAPHLHYLAVDLTAPASYVVLAERVQALEKELVPGPVEQVFYLALAPALVCTVVQQLHAAGLLADPQHSRIVVEKPFGHDLESARNLNQQLRALLAEKQIYRIDHYLGKETVQNILAFRFANSLFEPIWNRRYIDHVQLTVAETVGVEHRGSYYEQAGALRDMVQNHLFQILCCVAMEPPVSFTADEVRNKKIDVLRAIRPFAPEHLEEFAVRGQYGPGWIQGQAVPGYRQEPGVSPQSHTETYVALKLYIDNWRWQGVPFYLRTGKRLAARVSAIDILFRPVPHRAFPPSAARTWPPNRLSLCIQPEEGILLRFQAKEPGTEWHLRPVHLRFSYAEEFQQPSPEAYETLLVDLLRGDATLFMRADQVEAAWEALQPILDCWTASPADDFPNYPAGSWGPEAADALLAREGHHWVTPVLGEIRGRPREAAPAAAP